MTNTEPKDPYITLQAMANRTAQLEHEARQLHGSQANRQSDLAAMVATAASRLSGLFTRFGILPKTVLPAMDSLMHIIMAYLTTAYLIGRKDGAAKDAPENKSLLN